eukprot:6542840-Lingulodinium_polyedra.AAC.1
MQLEEDDYGASTQKEEPMQRQAMASASSTRMSISCTSESDREPGTTTLEEQDESRGLQRARVAG